jgi:predicted GNAT family acetyltransferase
MEIVKGANKVFILDENKNEIAYVSFPLVEEGVVEIDHTYVNESLRGLGIAGKLMDAAYEVIKQSNLKAKLSCSYAIKYFEKNTDKQDILK